MRIPVFYNLPYFDPLLVADAKINHYLKLMQKQNILHWQHIYSATLQETRLEFYNTSRDVLLNTLKNGYTPSYYLCNLTRKGTNRKALVKLRIGNHKLLVGTTKYPSCRSNEIGEIHFLFNCPDHKYGHADKATSVVVA